MRDAVEKQRHLAGIVAAHAQAGFVAAAGEVDVYAGQGLECLGDVLAVAAADVFGGNVVLAGIAAAGAAAKASRPSRMALRGKRGDIMMTCV